MTNSAANDPGRRRQGRRRRAARGDTAAPRGGAPACRGRAALHDARGNRPRGGVRVRRLAAGGAAGVRLRLLGRGRRRGRRSAVRPRDRRRLHRAARHTPASTPRTAGRRSSPQRARSPTFASAGSTRRRPRTSAWIEGGERAQRRARTLPGRRGGPLARRAEARRPDPGDARLLLLRRSGLGVRGGGDGGGQVPRVPVGRRRSRASPRPDGARAGGLHASRSGGGRRRGRERLQRARPSLRERRQRYDEHPHRRGGDRRRRPRGDGRRRHSSSSPRPARPKRGGHAPAWDGDRRSRSDTTGSCGWRWTGAHASPIRRLTGPIALGDDVLVNVQAVELGLGSGGLRRTARESHARPRARARAGCPRHEASVHVAPARVLHAEESAREESRADLAGLPVVCCSLHSQVAPVCAGWDGSSGRLRPARRRCAACAAFGHGAVCCATRPTCG